MTEKEIQDDMLTYLTTSADVILMNYYFRLNESDIFALYKSGYKYNYEIKVTLADFKRDFEKIIHMYLSTPDLIEKQPFNRWAFVVPESLLDSVMPLVPDYAGILKIVPDHRYPDKAGWPEVVKKPPLIHKIKVTQEESRRIAVSMSWKYYGALRRAASAERTSKSLRQQLKEREASNGT